MKICQDNHLGHKWYVTSIFTKIVSPWKCGPFDPVSMCWYHVQWRKMQWHRQQELLNVPILYVPITYVSRHFLCQVLKDFFYTRYQLWIKPNTLRALDTCKLTSEPNNSKQCTVTKKGNGDLFSVKYVVGIWNILFTILSYLCEHQVTCAVFSVSYFSATILP